MNRIPGLDGLRAVSILLVLYGHLAGTQYCYTLAFYHKFGDLANLGVRAFFVISGYLITLLLLNERQKTGYISLKQFYFRRTLRIFPAFYTFVAVVAVCDVLGLWTLRKGDLFYALTYMVDFHPERSWWVGHIWSLSVEEQFYLVWPATMLVLGNRKARTAALAMIAGAPIVRILVWAKYGPQAPIEFLPTSADAIAVGCILAMSQEWLLQQTWYRVVNRSTWFWMILPMIVVLNLFESVFRYAVLETLINIGVALCVFRVVTFSDDTAGKLLNWKPLAFVGTISYSLYLWQQLFLNRASHSWVCAFPQNLCFAFGAALLSYFCVERPALLLRSRIATFIGPKKRSQNVESIEGERVMTSALHP